MVSSSSDSSRGQVPVLQWQQQRLIRVTAFWVMGGVRHGLPMTMFALDSVPAHITDYFYERVSLPSTLLGAVEDTWKV